MEQEYSPSPETLKGALTLYLHADEFIPDFHAYARACLVDPEPHIREAIARPWSEWRKNPFYDQTMKLLRLTRGRCEPPKGEPPCDSQWNHTGHHLRYVHWGAEVAYMEDLRNVCPVHHHQFTDAQWRYAVLHHLMLEKDVMPQLRDALTAERDRLVETYEICDLPHRIQKWVANCGLNPTSSESYESF